MAQPQTDLTSRLRRKRAAALYDDELASKSASRPADKARRKVTYKLSTDLIERIEDLWLELRRSHRGSASATKDQIVGVALERALKSTDEIKKALGV